MKKFVYPLEILLKVQQNVDDWWAAGLYPSTWKKNDVIEGSHAECAVHVAIDPENGYESWYTSAHAKRMALGSDPKQRDDHDVILPSGRTGDVKRVDSRTKNFSLNKNTHATSTCDDYVPVEFDPGMTEFTIRKISRDDLSGMPLKELRGKRGEYYYLVPVAFVSFPIEAPSKL